MINDESRGTYSVIEPAQRTAARIVGLLYLVQMATGIFGQYVRDRLIVRGDAAKTALNITGAERLFRLSIAGDLITYILVYIDPSIIPGEIASPDHSLLIEIITRNKVSRLCISS